MQEVERFEVNEAFAAVALAVQSALDIEPTRLNPDGGAIAQCLKGSAAPTLP